MTGPALTRRLQRILTMAKRAKLAAALLLLTIGGRDGIGQVPDDYIPILLPVVVEGMRGKFGSVWTSELRLRNNGPGDVTIFYARCSVSVPCLPSFVLSAGQTIDPPLQRHTGSIGLMVYAPRVADLALNLRIADRSRVPSSLGTEIPVVRDFFTSRVVLVNIPLDEQSRTALRIYDPDRRDGVAFRVRILEESTSESLADIVVRTETGDTPVSAAPETPGVAELYDLRNRLQDQIGLPGTVVILIEPLTLDTRFWAFASVTNNATQEVTIISPH